MDPMIIQHSITSFMFICVIIVFASVFARSRFFTEIFELRPRWTTHILLIAFFGILSVLGSATGLSIYGAAVNVRDLGPMAGGLICGPYVGIGAGIIGGLFRFAQGGPYMWTGLSAPILSGFLGGILYLVNKRQFVPTWAAVLLIGLSETLISCYTLILVTKPAQFFTVVTTVAIPMAIFNVIGMFIFASVVHYRIRDIQTQKEMRQLEFELEFRKNLFTIINTIPYPVYVLDRNHTFILVNNRLCQFAKKTQEQLLGKTPADIFSEADATRHWEMSESVFLTKDSREDETIQTFPDGRKRTILSTSTLYSDSSGQEFLVGVIQDITERAEMQRVIRESEEWYRTLFDHTGAATIIINDDGTVDQANSEFCTLTGYTREEIEGRMRWTDVSHPDDLERVEKYHVNRRSGTEPVPSNYDVRILDKSKTIKTLHAVVALIPGTKKSIASYVDITEQKRYEDALSQANKKLNLLSSITRHDIINQIMILKGFLVLLKHKTLDAGLLEYLNRCERTVQNIEHQIIFTRDYQDMGVKAPVWQNIRSSIISAKGGLAISNVAIDITFSNIEVFVDPLFDKVFYNLIDNSLKYGGDQLQTIRISSQETDDGLIVTYEDDGSGIADVDRQHLFERGFGKHTGFGLFLSREILAITDIVIEDGSRQGSGARFILRIPRGKYRFAASP